MTKVDLPVWLRFAAWYCNASNKDLCLPSTQYALDQAIDCAASRTGMTKVDLLIWLCFAAQYALCQVLQERTQLDK